MRNQQVLLCLILMMNHMRQNYFVYNLGDQKEIMETHGLTVPDCIICFTRAFHVTGRLLCITTNMVVVWNWVNLKVPHQFLLFMVRPNASFPVLSIYSKR